jgi:hypothetical protein
MGFWSWLRAGNRRLSCTMCDWTDGGGTDSIERPRGGIGKSSSHSCASVCVPVKETDARHLTPGTDSMIGDPRPRTSTEPTLPPTRIGKFGSRRARASVRSSVAGRPFPHLLCPSYGHHIQVMPHARNNISHANDHSTVSIVKF